MSRASWSISRSKADFQHEPKAERKLCLFCLQNKNSAVPQFFNSKNVQLAQKTQQQREIPISHLLKATGGGYTYIV